MVFTCLFSHVSFIIYLYCISLWLRGSNSSWNYRVLLVCLKADNETEIQRGHYRSRIMQLFRFLVHFFFFLLLHTLVFHVHRAGITAYNSTLYLQGEKCICNTHTHIYCLIALIFWLFFDLIFFTQVWFVSEWLIVLVWWFLPSLCLLFVPKGMLRICTETAQPISILWL